ncbi:MAG TPA: hypothetical protein VEB18_01810 [Candidatus Paceibacterota bacterium]|nr:hypothetical protein [Candidatus Paceibacterota bacterium]
MFNVNAIPVFVIRDGRTVYEKTIGRPPHGRVASALRRPNQRTLADEVFDVGPEFALPSRLARSLSPRQRPLKGWEQDRYPSSWKDRSWKGQTKRPAQYLRHH